MFKLTIALLLAPLTALNADENKAASLEKNEHAATNSESVLVHPGPGGKLVYQADERGDVIPNF